MKNIFIVLAFLTLTGCDRDRTIERPVRVNELSFFKHPSGLCFAVTETRSYGGPMIASVTNIPCQNGDTVFVQ